MATYQVRTDANGQKILSDPLTGLSSTLATSELPGAVKPDGVTTNVDSTGILSAIGGNLLLNSEEWITESGTWTAPVTGWYEILAIDGGTGGHVYVGNNSVAGGASGRYKRAMAYFIAGQSISITIGAGGIGYIGDTPSSALDGGVTTVGGITFSVQYGTTFLRGGFDYRRSTSPASGAYAYGGGFGGRTSTSSDGWYGSGGGAAWSPMDAKEVANGVQGVVYMRWHDPAKAAGPSK